MDVHAQGRLLVLLALEARGGEASKQEALDFLEQHGLVALDAEAIEILKTRHEPRWRNSLAYARQDLVELGHVSGTQRNVWTMTASGMADLDRLCEEARTSSIRLDRLTPKTLEFLDARAGDDGPTPDHKLLTERVRRLRARPELSRPSGQQAPARVVRETILYTREARVKAWVLKESGGVCELCGKRAPFEANDGLPFLEVHHVVELAQDGPDTVENAVAVCPNCHRELHHGRHAAARRQALYERTPRLRRPPSVVQ